VKPLLTALAIAVFLLHAAVFVLFLVDDHRLGGDALNGGAADGRYWVSDHGRRTEVSAEDWRWNRLLEIVVFAGAPVAMAGTAFLVVTQVLPRFVYPRGADDLATGVRRVQGSGPAIASVRTGGRIGWCNFGGPLLGISVHPGGFVVKPMWMEAFAIGREQVVSVERKRILFAERIEIVHESPDVRTPIRLEGSKDGAFVAALEALNPRAGRPSGRGPGRPPSGRSGRP